MTKGPAGPPRNVTRPGDLANIVAIGYLAGNPAARGNDQKALRGLTSGHLRFSVLELTDAEKAATRAAFQGCGLKL